MLRKKTEIQPVQVEDVIAEHEGYTIGRGPKDLTIYKCISMLLFVQSMRTWLARRVPWSNSRQAWRERGALLVVLASALVLWGFAGRLPQVAQIVLWAILLLVAAYSLRRSWVQLFGPMLFFEMMRAGRRRRQFVFRILYASLLLSILFFAYWSWFLDRPESIWQLMMGASLRARELADFAAQFFLVFMVVQFLTIFWLTPAYTAGAITVEKERQTLDALLATDLRNHEIVLSTYVSRLANLGMLLLVGLPILAILQFMGGVDPNLVLAGFAASGLTTISLAALGTVNSLYASKPRDAVLWTYIVAVGYLFITSISWVLLLPRLHLANFPSTDVWTSPVELKDVIEWGSIGNIGAVLVQLKHEMDKGGHLDVLVPAALTKYAWFHGMVTVTCGVLTIVRFRQKLLEPRETLPQGLRKKRVLRRRWWMRIGRPTVSGRAVLWKELFVDVGKKRRLFGGLASGALLAAAFVPAIHFAYFFGRLSPTGPNDSLTLLMNYWVRGASAFLGCSLLLGVTVRAAGCVSGERDRQTLDGILATPLDNRTILWEKWLGCIFSQRWPWVALVVVWVLGFLSGALHPWAVAAFVVAWLAYAGFLAGLGLWFSVANRSTLKSVFGTLCTAVLMLGVLLLLAFDIPEWWMPKWLYMYWPLVTLPPTTLGFLAFSPINYDDWWAGKSELNFLPLVLVLQFIAWWICAMVLVCMANIRFRVVTGRTSGLPNPPCSRPPLPPFSRDAKRSVRLLPTTATGDNDEQNIYEEISGPSRPKRLVSWLLFLLPLAAVVAWYGYSHLSATKALEEAIANADRLDPGWRFQELENKRAVIPDQENSTGVIREVNTRLPHNWLSQEIYQSMYQNLQELPPEKQLSDDQTQKIIKNFERIEWPLVLARRVADMPHGRAPIQFSPDGLWIQLVDTQDARNFVNLLWYDTLLRAQEGDADGALDSCRGIINSGRSIGDEPSLVSALVRIAIRSVGIQNIERSLAQSEPSDYAMQVLQSLLKDEEKVPLLLIGMRGERAICDRLMANLQDGKMQFDKQRGNWGRGPELIVVSGSLKGLRAAFLEIMTDNVEAAKLPVEQQEAEFKRIDQSISLKPYIIRMLLPAGIRVEQAYWRSQAQIRTAIVALAVERYRRELGRWPESLAELVPGKLQQIYTDPYDGKPLRYRRNSDGVVIYSVGPDKIDDGGKIRIGIVPGADVGIQLWDPDKRRQLPPPKTAEEEAAVPADDDK